MFIAITGEPGSGKSAYAVDYILKNKDNFKNVYCNINGLIMHDNLKALNFKKLHEIISDCKDIYDEQILKLGDEKNNNVIDEPIVQYLLSIGFISENKNYDKYVEEKKQKRRTESIFEIIT